MIEQKEQNTIKEEKKRFNLREFFKNFTFKDFFKSLKKQGGWLFVLPAVLLLCLFTFYPIINSLISAFQIDYQGLSGEYNGWGFDNFSKVIKGDTATGGCDFKNCLINTCLFTFVSVPSSIIVALLISVALNSIKPLQKAYQTVLFLPYLTNSLAMGAVFATFFKIVGTVESNEAVGLFNNFLGLFGIEPVKWIGPGSNIWANRFVVVIYEIWSGLPFKILILFSALQNVNKQYYDAAKVDGANKQTILRRITVPLISPMLSYLLVTGIMGGMKQYNAVVGIFGQDMGGDYKVGTMVGYIYYFIENGYTGYAAAGALILFAIIMVITVINLRMSKKRVYF